MAMTNSFRFYNSEYSAITLGFMNEIGFLAISPVNEKYRGRKPKKGMSMYDHENRALFYLRQDEIANLIMEWDKIVSGEKHQEIVVDGGANNMTSRLTIGCGVFDTSDGDKKKAAKSPFQIVIEKFDEYDPQSDNEALETYFFQAKDEEKETILFLFKQWLNVTISLAVSGFGRHIIGLMNDDEKNQGSGRFNKFGGNNRKPKFSRTSSTSGDDGDDVEDFDEDSDDSSSKRTFRRKPSGKRPPVSKDDTFDDDDDDDIAF
jgi:hypothetical protein